MLERNFLSFYLFIQKREIEGENYFFTKLSGEIQDKVLLNYDFIN
jgi:hypothetical protein